MTSTPVSLLERLRVRPDGDAWHRLTRLYAPLVRGWLTRMGVQPADADDLTQETLAVLLRELPSFQHDLRPGAFRRWLKTIVLNRARAFWRGRGKSPQAAEDALSQLESPDSGLSREWDLDHDRHVARRLLAELAGEFEPQTWQAFRLLLVEGLPTDQVAARLAMTPNAVRIAKSRVLTRLRKEAEGLLD